MDLANLIFSTLKKVTLHLVVADIEIFTKETDPVPEGETSLKALKKWRKETRKTQPQSDALLNFVAKGRDMRGNAGLAYVGTVCTNQAGSRRLHTFIFSQICFSGDSCNVFKLY